MLVKIQNRRGGYSDFDPSRLLPGEFAIVQINDPNTQDGKAVYIAVAAGDVIRLATANEIAAYNAQSEAVLVQCQTVATTVAGYASTANTKAAEAEQSALSAAASEASIESMLDGAEDTINGYAETAKDNAISDLNDAYTERVSEINETIDELVSIKTNAEELAIAAKNKADELENDVSEVAAKADRNSSSVEGIRFDVDSMIHGWYVDVQKRLIFTDADGNPIGEPIEGIGGSGGGGGGGGSYTNAELSASNTTGWISKTISKGDTVNVSFTWSSIENNMPTGNGVVTIKVNNIIKSSYEVQQGNVTVNLTNYINPGANTIKIAITDIYDQVRTLGFNISVLDLRIESSFLTTTPFEGAIPFSYVPYGSVEKTVYIQVDGQTIHTQQTSASGRQLTYTIPSQSHGAHTLRVYFEADVNNQTVRSNELYYEFVSLETMNNTPIITSSFNTTTVDQYESVTIPYRVYTPTSDTSDVSLYINNTLMASATVDRTEQRYTFRANTAGTTTFRIVARNVTKSFTLTVNSQEIDVQAETQDLALYLSPEGRSNNEAPNVRNTWTYENIAATFSNFTWVLDGWQFDDDSINVLRLTDNARLTIPYKIFESDFKSTGKTIEVEFATRDVVNYDSVLISCFADNIGLKITSQEIYFAGAQTNISTRYKDNEHVRLSVVVQKQSDRGGRLILVYINGIMSRAIQYASGERFSQLTPVNITIGSNYCTTDIYCIRVYDNNLTRRQILTNWIADTQIGSLLLDRYDHNNVYDDSETIPISNLPKDLPYMELETNELPQYKGDVKTIRVTYVDPLSSASSFTATGVEANVQGTSSAPYYRKNYDLKFKNGFNIGNTKVDTYALRSGSIPFNRFVIKADVASSESANNTKLTMFYNDTCPYKTPEMLVNDKVRWGIEGIPIVVYWRDTTTGTTSLLGKYNFNLPKRAPTPLGYSGNMESWEFERNNSDNVKFKDDDFTSVDGDDVPIWYQDFEARMPSDEWRDYSQIKELVSWVKSTRRDTAPGTNLSSPVTYTLNTNRTVTRYLGDNSFTVTKETEGGVETGNYIIEFTKDTPAYRLTKFRAEFDDYFERQSVLFYYLFTELFLMIDSRAKNMFIGFRGSELNIPGRAMTRKAVCEPYDMDTAIGTNNSGVLMFGYFYEDTDTISEVISGEGGSNAPVYNAQDSVLWNNVRDAFSVELASMYNTMRSTGGWSYQTVKTLFEEHQAKWPEAIFNEDAYIKYIVPLVEPVTIDEDTQQPITTDRYLTMLQGSKAEQRKWWLYNRFKYLDSKYTSGSAETNRISARLFEDGTLTITPNTNCYVTAQFGGGTALLTQRAEANDPVSFSYIVPETSQVTEMETYIYSADLIADVGDLSGFYPNEVDFSKATKLRSLKLGDSSQGYSNANLRTFDVSNCRLLKQVDVRNCPNLNITVNLENSPALTHAYFDGTSITGADFADGGCLQVVHFPSTITALRLFNLSQLQDLQIGSYTHISQLMLANIDQTILDPIEVLEDMPANAEVSIQGLYLEASNVTEIRGLFSLFDTMKGVTREKINGTWVYTELEKAVISGEIHTDELTGAELLEFNTRYPYINVTADLVTSVRTYADYDGTILKQVNCINGIPQDTAPVPTRQSSAQYDYSFIGWSFEEGATEIDEDALDNVLVDRTIYAVYNQTIRLYPVRFLHTNGDNIATYNLAWNATFNYDLPIYQGQQVKAWNPEVHQVNGDDTYTAIYGIWEEVEIQDDWSTIISNIESGTFNYKPGNYKDLTVTSSYATATYTMQIVGLNKDELASTNGYAATTWISKNLGPTIGQIGANNTWKTSSIRSFLNEDYIIGLPSTVKNAIKPVKKYSYSADAENDLTEDYLWIPSYREVGTRTGSTTKTETLGPIYYDAFYNNDSRKKSNTYWLVRTKISKNYDSGITKSGTETYQSVQQRDYLIGFCI